MREKNNNNNIQLAASATAATRKSFVRSKECAAATVTDTRPEKIGSKLGTRAKFNRPHNGIHIYTKYNIYIKKKMSCLPLRGSFVVIKRGIPLAFIPILYASMSPMLTHVVRASSSRAQYSKTL